MTEEKSKWVKYGSIFAIIIMLGSAVLFMTMFTNDSPDKATPVDFTIKNAKDGVNYLPEGVLNIEIIKIYPNDEISVSLNNSFPGVTFDKVMVGSYENGILRYYSVKEGSKKPVMSGNPTYETYNGYSIAIESNQHAIVGNPLIIASGDNTLSRKIINILNKNSTSSTNFNDILSYADDTEIYEQIRVSKTSEGSNFSKYYQRTSQYENGTIQLETIVLNPTQSMKDDIAAFAGSSTENVTVTVTENGPAVKIYIDSADFISYATKTNELYNLTIKNVVLENSTA